MNEQEYVTNPLWNVIGIINGSLSNEVVVIGNHRDAWIAGGAGDPNSGSAALNEVIRGFGKAVQEGWKPLRTVVFASWDGEEYGLLGSTEWVEEYVPWLTDAAVAYVNVDVGSIGPRFKASASPILNKAINEIVGGVQSPNQTISGQTVGDIWDGYISTMGSGSDFTAFQDFAGIPSIDIGFSAGSEDPVYHYHSNYDSYWWMDNFGDPGFKYHATIAKILGLLVAKLSEEPVIQFNVTDYAFGLQVYLKSIQDKASGSDMKLVDDTFEPLAVATEQFTRAAVLFDYEASKLSTDISSLTAAGLYHDLAEIYRSVRVTNTKYKLLERQFLYAPGWIAAHGSNMSSSLRACGQAMRAPHTPG
jgi:N-acetylated-alpha-linked acidic dipeptidase